MAGAFCFTLQNGRHRGRRRRRRRLVVRRPSGVDSAQGATARRRAPELPSVHASSSSESTTRGRAPGAVSAPPSSSLASTAVASWRTREEASMCLATSRASFRTSNGTPFSLSARALSRPARASPPSPPRRRRAPRPRDRRRGARAAGHGTSCARRPSARATSSAQGARPCPNFGLEGPRRLRYLRRFRGEVALEQLRRRRRRRDRAAGRGTGDEFTFVAGARASGVLPLAARALVPPPRASLAYFSRSWGVDRVAMGALLGSDPITVVCCTIKTTARDATVRRPQRQRAVRGVAQILAANF